MDLRAVKMLPEEVHDQPVLVEAGQSDERIAGHEHRQVVIGSSHVFDLDNRFRQSSGEQLLNHTHSIHGLLHQHPQEKT